MITALEGIRFLIEKELEPYLVYGHPRNRFKIVEHSQESSYANWICYSFDVEYSFDKTDACLFYCDLGVGAYEPMKMTLEDLEAIYTCANFADAVKAVVQHSSVRMLRSPEDFTSLVRRLGQLADET